jgi:hypothetical protein
MDQGLANAVAELQQQGINVVNDASGRYVATAPNGEQYIFPAADLLELKAEGRLHLEGLQEAHLAQKETPDLHNETCAVREPKKDEFGKKG